MKRVKIIKKQKNTELIERKLDGYEKILTIKIRSQNQRFEQIYLAGNIIGKLFDQIDYGRQPKIESNLTWIKLSKENWTNPSTNYYTTVSDWRHWQSMENNKYSNVKDIYISLFLLYVFNFFSIEHLLTKAPKFLLLSLYRTIKKKEKKYYQKGGRSYRRNNHSSLVWYNASVVELLERNSLQW